jgi:hypothetical protein
LLGTKRLDCCCCCCFIIIGLAVVNYSNSLRKWMDLTPTRL